MASPKTWLQRMTMVLAGTGLGLLGAELGLRLRTGALGMEFLLADAPGLYDLSILQSDPATVVSLVPGSQGRLRTAEYAQEIRVNSLGLRGPEPGDRTPGELRVLAVGDSFTLGLQVAEEELFVAHLATGLARQRAAPVTVFNGGVDSHGTFHAVRHAVGLLASLDVDAVLLTFFTGNDFFDNASYDSDLRTPRSFEAVPGSPWRWLAQRSMLAMTARTLVAGLRVRGSDSGERHRRELELFTATGSLDRHTRTTRRALEQLEGICTARELQCFVAIASPAFVIYPDRMDTTLSWFGLESEGAQPDAPAAFVQGLLPRSLPGLDLSPALRTAAAASSSPLYFTLDGHWTPAGHAVVGEALTEWLGLELVAP